LKTPPWACGAGAATTDRHLVLSEDAATRAKRLLNCIVAQSKKKMTEKIVSCVSRGESVAGKKGEGRRYT
jgi:hypothetical protein